MSNKLKIDALQIKLEFSGSKEDIRRGYDMTRELLIMHFHEQLARADQKKREEEVKKAASQSRKTHAQWTPPTTPEVMHISIALCSDFYNKVCVLEREDYEKSLLADLLNFDLIQRIYVRSNQKKTFNRHFKIGKVLWRELTPEGRAAVRAE